MKISRITLLTLFMLGVSANARAEVIYPAGVSEKRMATEVLWKEIASMPPGQRPHIILVLGGGGARGLSHIGVLRVFEQERIPIDQIVGVSVGALIGGLYSAGLSVDEIEQMGSNIGWKKLTDFSRIRMTKLVFHEELFSTRKMETYLNRQMGEKTFADLRIPFACVATDIQTGEPVIFREGPVAIAARASATMPVIFSPVVYQGRSLVDGGLVDNLPVDLAKVVEGDIVVAVLPRADLNSGPVDTVFKTLVRAIDIQKERIIDEQKGKADFLIEPALGSISTVDLARNKECIQIGMEAALDRVLDLKQLIIRRVVERRRRRQGER